MVGLKDGDIMKDLDIKTIKKYCPDTNTWADIDIQNIRKGDVIVIYKSNGKILPNANNKSINLVISDAKLDEETEKWSIKYKSYPFRKKNNKNDLKNKI